MHIDPVKLEAERFGLTVEQAREMLTDKGTVRKRAKATRRKPITKKSQPKRESITKELNLNDAQKRAVEKWLKGLG
jgi:topoisomerase IA-like protein